MPDDFNVLERLTKAAELLATSAQPIQTRLGLAALELLPLQEHEFSFLIAGPERYTRLRSRLAAHGQAGERLDATDDEAAAIAHDLFSLFLDAAENA